MSNTTDTNKTVTITLDELEALKALAALAAKKVRVPTHYRLLVIAQDGTVVSNARYETSEAVIDARNEWQEIEAESLRQNPAGDVHSCIIISSRRGGRGYRDYRDTEDKRFGFHTAESLG